MNFNTYNAPWGSCLRWMSGLSCVISVALPVGAFYIGGNHHWSRWTLLLPLVLVPGAALFTIRGYTIAPDALVVRRLLWNTRLPLADLQSACAQPDAMRQSIPVMRQWRIVLLYGLVSQPCTGQLPRVRHGFEKHRGVEVCHPHRRRLTGTIRSIRDGN